MRFFLPVFLILFMNSVSLAARNEPAPVPGFADLHNHMFTEYAFGGGWLHGTVEGEIEKALASCETHFDPLSLLGDHARVSIPFVSRFIGKTTGSSGDTGAHPPITKVTRTSEDGLGGTPSPISRCGKAI